MTTLVETRRALQHLSMNNQPERRQSKRLAAEADYERDDDFVFTRKSKRAKTEESEPKKQQSGRARPAQGRVAKDAAPDAIEEVETATPPAKKKQQQQQTRRKLGGDVFDDEQLQAKIPKRSARQGSRQPDEQRRGEEPRVATTSTNGSSRGRNGPAKAKNAATAARSRHIFDSPPPEEVVQSKITLPMSDTPIINRNKEMRKKGTGDRRSSLGSRGRRASSLIESGQTALPHREVKPAQFYKHIEAEGLTEPRRMKQLLTWCGERALSEKPRHGTVNSSVIHGARAIQDQLLKDFGSRSEFSDWFSRDDGPKAPLVLKPNPRNTELDEKMAQLEKNIKRLQEEKASWKAMQKPPPEQPLLFSDAEFENEEIELPDFNLLDEEDGRIHRYLTDESESFETVRLKAEKRLQSVRSTLEFQVDLLADNIHKLEQRVSVAGEEADAVLKLSSVWLRERDERERMDAGTRDMPIMEVLRSLGSMLPEGGG